MNFPINDPYDDVWTGVALVVEGVLPNCPVVPKPHPCKPPSESTAKLNKVPELIATMNFPFRLPEEEMSTGTVLLPDTSPG
jgi:hypothetical protein